MSTQAPPSPPPPAEPPSGGSSALSWRLLAPAVVLVVIVGGLSLLLFGGSSKPTLAGGAKAAQTSAFAGSTISPPVPAPPLRSLRTSLGAPFDLASLRGRAVFVTFLYTHCPDVCPLIAANLHTALTQLGPKAGKVALVTVSVDPHGDTPAAVAGFLHAHQLTGEMSYLVGSARSLPPVWAAWHVGSQRDAQSPQFVNHSGLVYGISASGRLTTLYFANFSPSQIAHDVPGLLAS